MKKSINKIGIIILVIGVILIILGIVFAKINDSDDTNTNPETNTNTDPVTPTPKPTDNNTNTEDQTTVLGRKYYCEKPAEIVVNETNNIKFTAKITYSFVVMNDNSVSSDGYTSNMTFATGEDLNNYYNYLLNDTDIVNPNNTSISKDESNLSITYSNLMVLGGVSTFSQSYLDELTSIGYICNEDNSNLE